MAELLVNGKVETKRDKLFTRCQGKNGVDTGKPFIPDKGEGQGGSRFL